MGFPDDYPIVVSDTQAYRQFGNAVCPLVVEAVGEKVLEVVAAHLNSEDVCLLK
jgi:DNA (cytosine-5)-methyltransferase 1